MKPRFHIRRFVVREDGTLLVFFMISAIAILGIVALSFDLGRRASTQTDMQSFVDNVTLAAAGELDGSVDAIDNATRAATTVVSAANDRLRAGTAGQDLTIALDQIVFYRDLPPRDTPTSFDTDQLRNPDSPNYKYGLPPTDLGDTPDPRDARFVGIRLRSVDVPWLFAGVFSASDLPDASIGAVAVAGRSEWVCDRAPLLFCLPSDGVGGTLQLAPGQAAALRTARQGRLWRPGDFGFVDVDHDPTGPCGDLPGIAERQACMVVHQTRVAACFEPLQAGGIAGQRPEQESGAFDMAFDQFDDRMSYFVNDPDYAPGPNIMSYPLDDCHEDGSCLDGRFGDGDWAEGREGYLAENYSFPDHLEPGMEDGSFFDFPEPGLTRYRYYQREIERSVRGGVMSFAGNAPYQDPRFLPGNDGGRGTSNPEDALDYSDWDDFWEDNPAALNPAVPDALDRYPNGLAENNTTNLASWRDIRRVVSAGGIACPSGAGAVRGNPSDVEIIDFYRLFLLSPTTNESGLPAQFDLNVEVIQRVPVSVYTSEREVVQLYR